MERQSARLGKLTRIPLRSGLAGLAGLALLSLIIWGVMHWFGPSRKFYTIGVFYNSVNLKPEDLAVIRFLVDRKVTEINAGDGLGGRILRIRYLDDEGNRETARKLVRENLQDPTLVAFLGSWGTSRVQAVADLVGKSGVPYIGGYSVTSIGAPYPNMFSYEIGVDRVAFVVNQLLRNRAKKVALIGNAGDIYSEALFREIKVLQKARPDYAIGLEKWYPDGHKFTAAELDSLSAALKLNADFLLLSANPGHTNILVAQLARKNLELPVISAFSDIPEIDPDIPGFRDLELYDISVFGIPSALNMRCQELEARYKKELETSKRLQFQLGLGGLYADAIGLFHEASVPDQSGKLQNAPAVRRQITAGLHNYINGLQVYKGWFSDWYFTPDRALVNEVLLGWKPPTLETPILAPEQYLRSDSGLQVAPVLFTTIDLMELDQISDETGRFNASFFLEVNSRKPFTLEQIDFVNAVRNEVDHKPLLAVKSLSNPTVPTENGFYRYLYRITGQFYFKPDLKKYPFDRQRFSIILQTNSALKPFLIQPPDHSHSDTAFASPGWIYANHFVGFDQDLIYSARNFVQPQGHMPYYKFSYTFELKRAKVDFALKVLTPLLVLLVLAYFSVFVPIREFVSVTTIQVTALLSSIALYFSAYKPVMAAATISDGIFIFTFLMITTMIGATVLQYWLYRRRRSRRRLGIAVGFYEKVIFPLIVLGFSLYIVL